MDVCEIFLFGFGSKPKLSCPTIGSVMMLTFLDLFSTTGDVGEPIFGWLVITGSVGLSVDAILNL